MEIRKAKISDIDSIEKIYEKIHDSEEKGLVTIGWIRTVYPTRKTAEDALNRDDLFVMVEEGKVVATAIINQVQVEEYKYASWRCMDTNARNMGARKLYQHLGYEEVGIVECVFNGIPNVQLVCLEKYLG